MKRRIALATHLMLLIALVNHVNASDGSAMDQFLGSPLLILGAIFVIDIIAFAYHKIRK
jgi:hypothetical protein